MLQQQVAIVDEGTLLRCNLIDHAIPGSANNALSQRVLRGGVTGARFARLRVRFF